MTVRHSLITVALADRNPLLAAGVASLLETAGNVKVAALEHTAEALLFAVRKLEPRLAVVDAEIPSMGGVEVARRLVKTGRTSVVCLVGQGHAELARQLLSLGVSAAVLRRCRSETLSAAIAEAASGGVYLEPALATELALRSLRASPANPFDALSRRELQITLLITRGSDTAAISRCLCLSPKTVSTYRYRIGAKLGTCNDVQLTRMALRHGLVEAGLE